MIKLFKYAIALSIAFSLTAQAKLVVPTSLDELPVLSPEAQHTTACSRTANYFLRAHYKAVNLDDAFADNVIKQFLSYIDYTKSLYTKDEVKQIYGARERVIRAIELCDMSFPYALYTNAMKRRFEKYKYFLEQIKEGIDVSVPGTIAMDRSKGDFVETHAELRDLWLAELKNDYINQVLQDKSDKEARDRLKRRYEAALARLVQVESEDIFSTFENAFATAIDPHTSYLSPIASESFNEDINLSLEGIGAVLTIDDEYTVINSVVPGSPAELSKKIKPKDRIVGVRQEDGSYDDIIGWRLTDVVRKIKGPKGTSVFLDMERGEGASLKSFTVELVRDKIRLQERAAKGEVKTSYDGQKVGVLSIKSFYTDLHKDIQKELEKLKKEQISSLVIDLRSNGGGLLPEATASTGLFIKDGPVVLVRDVVGNIMPQIDTDSAIAYDGPLVVLINRLSASSSEIMAAALSDYGRALIVGDTSFGKGTVQQNRPLARVYDFANDKLGSIHYTIAKFYRINGGSTQLKGVSPDIAFPAQVDDSQIGERSEENALEWDKIKPVSYDGYLNIAAYVPELTLLHKDRVKDNLAFKILKSEMQRYLDFRAQKVLSVNIDDRRKLKEDDDAIRLSNVNSKLKEMGKKPLKNIKDLPEDFEFPDALLNEAVNIAGDFARLQSQKLYKASDAPIFTRYSNTHEESDKQAKNEEGVKGSKDAA